MTTNFRYNFLKTIRPYAKYFPQMNSAILHTTMQLAIYYIDSSTQKCSPEILDLALMKLNNNGHTIPENFCELFAAVLQIMQIFLRTPKGVVKDQEFRECLKDLRLSDECVEDLCKVLYNHHHHNISRSLTVAKTSRPSIKNLQWRINISLNDGVLNSNLPTIILHFRLPNGRYRTLELPLSMFHKLRYNVALLLSEMHALERRGVMKKF